MDAWLEPLAQALDRAPFPVPFFFRDDDAGWADSRLDRLLDRFADYAVPIDLAVIPDAVDGRATPLPERVAASRGLIGVHQHGLRHVNHQPHGRRCEFGDARSKAQQKADIESGRVLLERCFGGWLDPIFTPPWNRCSQSTVAALTELGFSALSRDASAAPLDLGGLIEIPVAIDWFKKRGGERLGLPYTGQALAAAAAQGGAVGIMLHHAEMDRAERDTLTDLLILLANHPAAACQRMNDRLRPSAD